MNLKIKTVTRAIVLIYTLFLTISETHANIREKFIENFEQQIPKQLCENTGSPFKQLYKGKPENCQSELLKNFSTCVTKVIPKQVDPKRGIETTIMLTQCLIAHYQGGQELATYNKNFSQKFFLERESWLKNLLPVMKQRMCSDKKSDFGRAYKGTNCPKDIHQLFSKCTKDVKTVKIPEKLESLRDADHYAQIIAACITAHYVGGNTLEQFLSIN